MAANKKIPRELSVILAQNGQAARFKHLIVAVGKIDATTLPVLLVLTCVVG